MASSSRIFAFVIVLSLASSVAANGQYFCPDFYSQSCPNLQYIVREVVTQAVAADPRAAASLLRLHFHDCFVQGCDASVLLDGGEKNAPPNLSLRRFDVIDDIKARVEDECCGVVSCADILALAALEAVAAVGGHRWPLNLGRRDALSAATVDDTSKQLPAPSSSLPELISAYGAKGLDTTDMTALSGAHTIGLAHCNAFRDRIYNDTNIDPGFAAARRATCPRTSGDSNTAPLDFVTPAIFDNTYYKNLVAQRGLLHSDQVLFNRGSQDALVLIYSAKPAAFFVDFAKAMTKMSEITPLTGDSGEIRNNCHVRN